MFSEISQSVTFGSNFTSVEESKYMKDYINLGTLKLKIGLGK